MIYKATCMNITGYVLTDKDVGTLTILKRSRTGMIYVPADLMKDSQFPLKVGKVKISIQGKHLIVEQA
jgi:hypothetical protein